MQRANTLSGLYARAAAGGALAACGLLFATIGHPAQAQDQAGVTAAVRGRVELAVRSGEVGRLIKSGEPVYLGNAIKSGPEAGLQLLLLDQTTFTIGPDSEITIDEFVYDPARGAGKVTASVAKGVFRFVTGKVAQGNPADMVVKLPVGTIGIRGTIAMGSVERPNAQTLDGIRQQVVLVGPGSNVDSKDRIGAIFVSTNSGGGTTINQPGFGSQFGYGGQGWGSATRFTPEMIAGIQNRLNPPPPPGGGGGQQDQGSGGQATANAGAGTMVSKGEAQQLALLTNAINYANDVNNEASNQQVRDTGISAGQQQQNAQQTQTIIDGISTFGQLQQITTGTFNYTQANVPLFTTSGASSGTYNLGINIDFGARQIATAGSYLSINSPLVSGLGIPNSTSFAGASPDQFALFFFGNDAGVGEFVGSGCGTSQNCNVNVLLAPVNANGKTAASLLHALEVLTDQDGDLLSGFGLADQQPGAVSNPNPIANGTSSYEQLRSINSGQFYYSQSNVPLSGGGSYNLFANIDFGARTFGGGNSRVVVSNPGVGPTNYAGTVGLGTQSYASFAGAANFQFINTTSVGGTGCQTFACRTTVNIAPQNANNTVALQANHNVTVQRADSLGNPTLTLGQGNGTAGRIGGLAP